MKYYFQDIGHQGTEDKDSAEIANDADMPYDCPSLMPGVSQIPGSGTEKGTPGRTW